MSTCSAGALPALQKRSRDTRDRLLDAAEELLTNGGIDAATAPNIARRAGVAVGSLYRRFEDKDAVLKAVYERFFLRGRASNERALHAEYWAGVGAGEVIERLVGSLVIAYVRQRRLLAALIRFAETHADESFRKQADDMRQHAFDALADLLMKRKSEIGRDRPDEAIRFALVVIGATLKQILVLERPTIEANRAATQLTEMIVGFLQIRPVGRRRALARR